MSTSEMRCDGCGGTRGYDDGLSEGTPCAAQDCDGHLRYPAQPESRTPDETLAAGLEALALKANLYAITDDDADLFLNAAKRLRELAGEKRWLDDQVRQAMSVLAVIAGCDDKMAEGEWAVIAADTLASLKAARDARQQLAQGGANA